MKEKLIKCFACRSQNLDNSVYCCQCGSPLRKGITRKGMPVRISKTPWIAIIVITLILSFTMTSVIHFFSSRKTSQQSAVNQSQVEQSAAPVRTQADSSEKRSFAGRFLPEEKETEE